MQEPFSWGSFELTKYKYNMHFISIENGLRRKLNNVYGTFCGWVYFLVLRVPYIQSLICKRSRTTQIRLHFFAVISFVFSNWQHFKISGPSPHCKPAVKYCEHMSSYSYVLTIQPFISYKKLLFIVPFCGGIQLLSENNMYKWRHAN